MYLLEKWFKLNENNTTIKQEVLGGFTTFITVAYALLVIPNLLKAGGMNSSGAIGDAAESLSMINDPIIASAFASTCLAAAIGTLIMAFHANVPFVLAPGIGLTAFFSYNVCLNFGYTWQEGLAAVMLSGLVLLIITLSPLRALIINAIPKNIKLAITGGIGLFIALIGLKSTGIIVAHPSTLVAFGDFTNANVLLAIIGVTIMAILMARNVPGAMLLGVLITTLIGIPLGITNLQGVDLFSIPPIGETFFAFDFAGLLSHGGSGLFTTLINVLMIIITLSLVDLFDTIGTLVGTAQKANMLDENGEVKQMKKALSANAVSTSIGGALGTTTLATVVESTAGIAAGARTGLSNVVVSLLFLASLFFSGVVGAIPIEATAPALILVGVLMMSAVTEIDFSDLTESVPVFFTIALMPFSYSIANGIAAGLIFYPLMKLATGQGKEVHPISYVLAVLFIIRFVLLPQ